MARVLWDSAIQHLTDRRNTFEVKDWKTIVNAQPAQASVMQFVKSGRRATDPVIPVEVAHPKPTGDSSMPKAQADEKKAAQNAAKKKLAANGVTKPKHVPGESAPGVKGLFPASTPSKSGVDSNAAGVVQSGVSSTTTGDTTMTDKTPTPAAGPAGSRTDPAKAAAKAESLAKSKAETEAKRAEKKAADEKAKADAKVARDAALVKARADREAKHAADIEAKKAALPEGSKRTYLGSMTALAERVKDGVYVKGLTGQLRSNDDLAVALDAVPTDNVIKLAIEALGLPGMPEKYAALNRGQQSMNLRNRLRGAIKANDGAGLKREDGTLVTLDLVKAIRDKNGYATAEAAAAEKTAKKEAAAKVKADAAAAAKAKKDAEAKTKADAAEAAKKEKALAAVKPAAAAQPAA